jgi:hypothetical protein
VSVDAELKPGHESVWSNRRRLVFRPFRDFFLSSWGHKRIRFQMLAIKAGGSRETEDARRSLERLIKRQ